MSAYREVSAAMRQELSLCLDSVREEDVSRALEMLLAAPRIFCAGAGRSGLAVRAFAMRLMHLGRTAHVVGDATTPGIGAEDLLVIGSGSGQTASLVAAARRAKDLGAGLLLFTIDNASPLAELADHAVVVGAPSEKAAGGGSGASMQPMGSLFEQALFLLFDALVVLLMQREELDSKTMFSRHANLE